MIKMEWEIWVIFSCLFYNCRLVNLDSEIVLIIVYLILILAGNF